ncbi:MAG TPA: pitrilysin family protein [Terriglobales bacterium]|nr:pitrilysin family protein [Terriglobales bacterium]
MKRSQFLLAAIISLLCLGLVAIAQEEGSKAVSITKVQRLNRAPVNKQVLEVKLPRPAEFHLPNGLTVLVLERHELPTVDFALWIKSGALDDPKDLPGLAKFTADMLREGTAHRSSAQIASEIDAIGAAISAGAEFGSSHSQVVASGLAENTGRLLDLMSDMVENPTFPQDELAKYKTRQLADLEQERSDPEFLAMERFHRVLYQDFPAAVIAPTPASVKAATSEQLKQFHDRYYAPNNAILGVAGDVQAKQVIALIEKYFGPWKKQSVSQPKLAALPAPAPARVYLVDRPGSVQTNIVAGSFSLRRVDPDFIPLRVMNRILGEGATGRLFLNLREEKGYTYGAFSAYTADVYPGNFAAETQVRNAVTDGSLHELLGELKRIRDEAVKESDLEDARHAIVASFALSLERPATLLNYWMTSRYYGLPEDYWERYPAEVSKVTPEVVQRMARKYIDLDHLQVVCVGDGKQIKNVLSKYGTVEVYDSNGNPVATGGN